MATWNSQHEIVDGYVPQGAYVNDPPHEWTEEEKAAYWEELYAEPCDCGTVFGPSGFYLTHAEGEHPACTGADVERDRFARSLAELPNEAFATAMTLYDQSVATW